MLPKDEEMFGLQRSDKQKDWQGLVQLVAALILIAKLFHDVYVLSDHLHVRMT